MNNGITFKVVLVTIMIDFPVKCIGIYSQVPYGQGFENQPESLHIINQILRAQTKSCGCYGRINEIPGI